MLSNWNRHGPGFGGRLYAVWALVACSSVSQLRAEEPPPAYLIRVPVPIVGNVDSLVQRSIDRLLVDQQPGGPRARAGVGVLAAA